jgi:predicted permease
MLRTFVNLTDVDTGFDAQNVLTGKMAYSLREFDATAKRWRLHSAALERVRQLPGVEDVAAGGPLPLDDWQPTREYGRVGEPLLTARATIQSVLPGYLRVTRTPLVEGREFTEDDIADERPVVIVDQRIAQQLWPGRSALGEQLLMRRTPKPIALEVIGVSRPVRVTRVRDEGIPHFFIPYHLFAVEQALVIRTRDSAATLGPAIKHAVESVGTRRPFYDIRPLQAYIDASLGDTRFMMLVLTGFGVASMLLAAIGLYGTVSYLASLRTHEFGIRMALGASTTQVLTSVAGEGLVLAAIGAVIGFTGAVATSGMLRGLLYDVTPFDGVTLAGAVAVVALTALVASTRPALRAARINPMRVLREAE